MISTEDNDSDVAMYNEGTSLDSCTGHSSADGQYHYHANILCDQEAADPDTCKHIGYMRYKHAGEFVMDDLARLHGGFGRINCKRPTVEVKEFNKMVFMS